MTDSTTEAYPPPPMAVDLDETDRIILAHLQADGRMTNVDVAERVHLSPSACLRRIRRLEASGVIDRYVALVDPVRVGRPTDVFVEISLTTQAGPMLDAFEAAVLDTPEIISCHLMAGDADYLLRLKVAGVADYERIYRDHLSRLPGVARMHSRFALRTVSETTALQLDRVHRRLARRRDGAS